MDNRSDVRDFLVSRRGKVTPDRVGLPVHGARRVPGLRRDEVARLAGVSVEYYTQMERGRIGGASEAVLDAVARALLLDEAERVHLFDLARAANTSASNAGSRRRPAPTRVRPVVQQILDAQMSPAWVSNGRRDIVATNTLGRALLSPLFEDPTRPVNTALFRFLNPRAADYYRDWEGTARDTVAGLRTEAAKNPYDQGLIDLIGQLCTRSDDFRTRWGAHDVHLHRSGFKAFHHPIVGDLDLSFEGLELPSDAGLMLFIFTAEPGSPSHHGLDLLASWAATTEREAREQLTQSDNQANLGADAQRRD